jgi:hypothetical protein
MLRRKSAGRRERQVSQVIKSLKDQTTGERGRGRWRCRIRITDATEGSRCGIPPAVGKLEGLKVHTFALSAKFAL